MKKKLIALNVKSFILPLLVAFFNIFIIFYPQEIIAAAKDGIGLWFNNVFPSLLPFIIGTNLLSGLGAISFVGTLLEPLMQPLFGVPGSGGFALITGMTSGYPMGAKVTATLRQSEQISQTEAQRLLSFTNNSGPLFILGAVGIGMFKSQKAGYYLMFVHYIGAILTGLIFKYYRFEQKPSRPPGGKRKILAQASKNMKDARVKDGRSLGQLLGDSVGQAMESMLQIGGFIILFCVLVKILELLNITYYTQHLLENFIKKWQLTDETFNGLFYGIMEVTNGARTIASENFTRQQLISVAVLISFGGFSIHAQSINFLSKTDIKPLVYILSKTLHAAITFIICQFTYHLFDFESQTSIAASKMYGMSPLNKLYFSTMSLLISLLFLGVIAIFVHTGFKIRKNRID